MFARKFSTGAIAFEGGSGEVNLCSIIAEATAFTFSPNSGGVAFQGTPMAF